MKRLTVKQAARRIFHGLPIEGQPQRTGDRPRTRGDCEDGCRPCPWTECRYHLATDVVRDKHGGTMVFWAAGWDWSKPSCALDVADDGPQTQEDVARLLGLTRQRLSVIEAIAIAKARSAR